MNLPCVSITVAAMSFSGLATGAELDFAARIAAFEELRNRPLPEEFDETSPTPIRSRHFDLSEYFNVFPHLRLVEGRVLDWVYDGNEMAGGPMLYSRLASDPPFDSVAEFVDSIRERAQLDEVEKLQKWYDTEISKLSTDGTQTPDPFGGTTAPDPFGGKTETDAERRRQLDIDILRGVFDLRMKEFKHCDYTNIWREVVLCDGTDEGFKELAALYLMGSEFFLYWHAQAFKHRVFVSREQMMEGLEDLPPGFFEEKDETKLNREEAIGLLDPSPTVVRHARRVQVRLLVFEELHGYVRKVFTFSEDPPHDLLSERDIVEAAYVVTRIF